MTIKIATFCLLILALSNACLIDTESKKIDLSGSEKKVFSQNGEDGVLESIFNHIGSHDKYYVEFGAEDATECNTRYLREKYGWHGLLMDGGNQNDSINLQKEFITAENIIDLFTKYNVKRDLDLLSVDIDGMDYWVLKKILEGNFRPRVLVVEYNSSLPLSESLTLTYRPNHSWSMDHSCDPIYSGSSLLAFKDMLKGFGYELIYCEKTKVNLFFVKSELADKFSAQIDLSQCIRRVNGDDKTKYNFIDTKSPNKAVSLVFHSDGTINKSQQNVSLEPILTGESTWTEYSLYWLNLAEKTNVDELYFTDDSRPLTFGGSVWDDEQLANFEHKFTERMRNAKSSDGPFLVVQGKLNHDIDSYLRILESNGVFVEKFDSSSRNNNKDFKFSVVLPILERDIPLFRLQLRAFYSNVDPNIFKEIILIVRDGQIGTFEELRKELDSPRFPLRIVPESLLLGGFDPKNDADYGGWWLQQILKMAAPKLITTPYYLTIDADTLPVLEVRESYLQDSSSGKLALSLEPVDKHYQWWKSSASILDLPIPEIDAMSVTPQILVKAHTTSLLDNLKKISERLGAPSWIAALMNNTYLKPIFQN